MDARHTTDGTASVAASLYTALPSNARDRGVTMATIEPRLEQLGQEAPTIRVAFRSYDGTEQHYNDELLRLSIDDTEDLIAVLQHLVKTAGSA